MILSKIERREMGLKLFGSNVEPPLCKGSTLAIFSMTGKTPVKNDTLIMWHSGITIKSTTTLSIFNEYYKGQSPCWVKIGSIQEPLHLKYELL